MVRERSGRPGTEFRIAQTPWTENGGQHILTLSFELKGSWRNSEGARSRAVTLQDENGRPALRYGGLVARDAPGRELPAWMVLDGQTMRLEVAAQGADFPVTIDPMYSQIAQLSATTGPAGAPSNLGFATSVSDDGTVVVVGACGYDTTTGSCSSTAPGAAYVLVEPAGGWQTVTAPAATLTSLDSTNGDNFGYAVAISSDGTTIVVSAPGGGSAPGAAYVFVEPAGGWATAAQAIPQMAKLLPFDSSPTVINFSQSLAISGDGKTLVARSFNENTNEAEVYVFTAPGGNWQTVTSPTVPVNETARLAPAGNADRRFWIRSRNQQRCQHGRGRRRRCEFCRGRSLRFSETGQHLGHCDIRDLPVEKLGSDEKWNLRWCRSREPGR